MLKRIMELLFALAVLAGLLFAGDKVRTYVSVQQENVRRNLVVLDPGHGGKDPGKVGADEELEKDINLAISLKVREKLEEDGMEVVMTREEDVMLSDGDADNKKLEDLNSRIDIINEQQPAIAVSIHQNSYSDPAVRGAQVFYFTHSDKGKQAAEALQKELLEFDQENTRDIKANDTYYLLKKTEVPTVIVECGFLSCPGEAELLTDEAYQEELAGAIAKGIESWVVK
ncbi:N-acetylmuramoyl-L-alanine amidase [Lachnoclostridium sp. An118]|uniref:N-acetylmuramoyl-L-alanine amidase n=1 Tax=Lachnoclostridium sp. An118 TaxID=1965547 RepID=UPI001FA8AA25|nr:N-acetylmuramoyl-L-alanine amidase [Lachnoclostridium sp. An118]